MSRARLLPAVALAAGLLLAAAAGAQPGRPVPAPPPLPVVPASAGAFVTLKVSDLANHSDLKPVLAQLAKQPDAAAGLTELVGVSPLEIDRVTLFWPRLGRGGAEPVVVVTTAEPFNEARVLKTLRAVPVFDGDPRRLGGPGGWVPGAGVKPGSNVWPVPKAGPGDPRSEKHEEELNLCAATVGAEVPDPLFYALSGDPFGALFLVDERTLVFLPNRRDGEFAASALLASILKKNPSGPLAAAVAAAGGHTFAAGIDLAPFARELGRGADRQMVPYTALFGARTAVVTGDLTRTVKFNLTLRFDDASAARRAAPVLEEGIAALGTKADQVVAELRDSPQPFERAAAPVLAAAVAGLKKAVVTADGPAIRAAAEVEAGPVAAKAVADLILAAEARRKAALRTNNLKQIGLALHIFHDSNGFFPTDVYGPDGNPLLSWRVRLLPYLEHDALGRQFKMDEPWDSEHNAKLVEQMPKVFQAPDRKHAKGETFYQGFVERARVVPGRAWAGRPWLKAGDKNGLRITGILDGTSNTLAVVEARAGVVWSKPDDLPFGGAVPSLGEPGWDAAPALRFDGSVGLFPNGLRPEEFWPFVTINGGEVTPDPEDYRRGPRR